MSMPSWQQWATTNTAATTDFTIIPNSVIYFGSPDPPPNPEVTPLDWLRHQVDEICLAAAA